MSRHSQITPRFDKALFKLLSMDHPQQWANVSNALEITHNGHDTLAYVEVSTTLFPLLADLGVSIDSEVSLYLEDDGNRMLFGIVVDGDTEEGQLVDLWHYTMDQIPKSLLSL